MTKSSPAGGENPSVRRDIGPPALCGVLMLLLLAWQLLSITYSAAVSPVSDITGIDFKVFYHAAVRLDHGLPLYQPDLDIGLRHALYCYSPLPAELMRPLGTLPFEAARRVWFFLNAGSLLAAVVLYGLAARLPWRSAWMLGIIVIVSFRFWDNTLNFVIGQSNDLLLGLVGGMLWADSRGRWGLMGALIAAAALLKIWMIGLLIYLLLRRQWKPFFLGAAGFAGVLGLSFSLVGWHALPDFVRVLQESKAIQDNRQVQSSIIGFANVAFQANPHVTPLADSHGIYLMFVVLGTAAIFGGFVFLWHVLRRPSPLEARLGFGVTLASILLLLPTYENGYFIYSLPLLWTLLVSPETGTEELGRSRTSASSMLVGGLIVYAIFSRPWPFFTPFPASYQHGLKSLLVSMKFFGTVSLWALGLAALYGWKHAESLSSSAIPQSAADGSRHGRRSKPPAPSA